MVRAYLGLGSNVGDSPAILCEAFSELAAMLGEARLSRLRGSRAMYDEDQPDFVNAVVVGTTSLAPRELLAAAHGIEARFGRIRDPGRPKGPRALDIDILIYGDRIVREPDLTIPHASLGERRFALEPLLELEPDLRDPSNGQPYSAILEALPPQGIYLME